MYLCKGFLICIAVLVITVVKVGTLVTPSLANTTDWTYPENTMRILQTNHKHLYLCTITMTLPWNIVQTSHHHWASHFQTAEFGPHLKDFAVFPWFQLCVLIFHLLLWLKGFAWWHTLQETDHLVPPNMSLPKIGVPQNGVMKNGSWSLQATNHYPQWVVWLWSEELKVSLGISCINMLQ